MKKVYDFHTHTFLSDGALICSEQIRHAQINNYEVIAITDHVDISNIDFILNNLKSSLKMKRSILKI